MQSEHLRLHPDTSSLAYVLSLSGESNKVQNIQFFTETKTFHIHADVLNQFLPQKPVTVKEIKCSQMSSRKNFSS